MSNRFLVWMLAVLAVALILVPLLGMLGMMSAGWMTGGGMMHGMGIVGTVWTLLAIIVVAALVVLLVQQATKV